MFAKRLLYKVLPHNKGSKMVTNLDLQVVLHYGIPYTSSILAFDPIQRLLAIGTLDGRIKIVGGDNIEGLLISPKKLPYKYLEFLQNQGVLIGVTNDNDIQVWDLEHRRLACSFQWETNITAFAIIHGTSLMYIGDENGMLYVLKYDSEEEKLLNLAYNIPAKSIFESAGISCPIYQSVVGILPQPSSSGTRVLIAYENGVMILWDVSESLVITVRGYTDLQLKEEEIKIGDNQSDGGDEQEEKEICSLCWVTSSGSILAVGYINGDILLWDFSPDLYKKQQSASSSPSKAVVKLQLASGKRRLPVIVLNWSANASLNDKGGQLLIYGGDDIGSEEVLTVLNLEWASGVDSLKCLSRADLKLSGSFADMILIPNAGAVEHSSTAALFVLTNPGQLNVYDGALLPVLKTDEEKYTVEAEEFPMVIPSIDPCITVTKICLLDPGSNISKKFIKADTKRHDESPTLSCGTRWPLTGGVPIESVSKNGVERIYVAAYQDGSVRIWDATYPTLSLMLFLQAKVPGIEVDNPCASVSALDFCPTNMSLAVGNDCGLVRIYKLLGSTDESSIHIVSQTTHEVFAAQHGDGYHCTAIFLFPNSFIQSLTFTCNGQKLAVGFKNGQVAMLDMNSWSIVFCTDCLASTPSPVISITFLVDPQLNSKTEVILILKKDAHFVIIDSMSGKLVSSRQMHTKKEPAAISMYVIDGDNHVAGIANEKPSQNPSDEKSFQRVTPSNECSNDASKSNELLLDSYLLLCHDDLLWFGPLKSVTQGSSDYVHKANLAKRCCWSAVFKKRNEDGLGLILLYETGDLEMRSLPDLEVLAENSLMSILRWSFKTNMEKSMSSCTNGLIAMVNGCELAIVSLLECENVFRIPESLPCLHDKVVEAAADAAISLSANQKKKQRAGYGILGGILKGLKGTKSENDPNVTTSIEISNSMKLEEFFSKDPFVNTSATIVNDNEGELNIDDIKIDDVVPASSSSTTVNKHMKSSESAEREKLFQGATVDNKPRIRTTQEIMTQYRFNGDVRAAAAHAKDKLMERQEKLEGMMNNCWFRVKINVCKPYHGEIGLVFEHPTQPGNQTGGWMARKKHLEISYSSQLQLKRSTSTPFMNTTANKHYSLSDVRKHSSAECVWIVVHGHVYDCTAFLKDHPGGADIILINVGTDCTEEFDAIHSEKAKYLIDYLIIFIF